MANTSFHGNTAADFRTNSVNEDDGVSVKADVGGKGRHPVVPDRYGRVPVRYDDSEDDDDFDENKENVDLFGDDGVFDEEGVGRGRKGRDDTFDDIEELRDQMQQCLDLETWG